MDGINIATIILWRKIKNYTWNIRTISHHPTSNLLWSILWKLLIIYFYIFNLNIIMIIFNNLYKWVGLSILLSFLPFFHLSNLLNNPIKKSLIILIQKLNVLMDHPLPYIFIKDHKKIIFSSISKEEDTAKEPAYLKY